MGAVAIMDENKAEDVWHYILSGKQNENLNTLNKDTMNIEGNRKE